MGDSYLHVKQINPFHAICFLFSGGTKISGTTKIDQWHKISIFYKTFRAGSGFNNNWRTSCNYIRLRLLAYAWFWTCVRWQGRSFFSIILQSFQNFSVSYNFILFKNLLLYIWPLIYLSVLGRDIFFTVYICFKETLLFSFSYKLFNKYFSLPQSTCEFRLSVRK